MFCKSFARQGLNFRCDSLKRFWVGLLWWTQMPRRNYLFLWNVIVNNAATCAPFLLCDVVKLHEQGVKFQTYLVPSYCWLFIHFSRRLLSFGASWLRVRIVLKIIGTDLLAESLVLDAKYFYLKECISRELGSIWLAGCLVWKRCMWSIVWASYLNPCPALAWTSTLPFLQKKKKKNHSHNLVCSS